MVNRSRVLKNAGKKTVSERRPAFLRMRLQPIDPSIRRTSVKTCRKIIIYLSFFLFCLNVPSAWSQSPPVTVAEKSDYHATSRHAEVVDFCEKLADQSKLVRLTDMGKSSEGRRLPMMIIAEPPVATPEEAAKSGKLVVLVIGNIHAGEVDGKEALLM